MKPNDVFRTPVIPVRSDDIIAVVRFLKERKLRIPLTLDDQPERLALFGHGVDGGADLPIGEFPILIAKRRPVPDRLDNFYIIGFSTITLYQKGLSCQPPILSAIYGT
jgi:hypothetical protein